MTLQRAQEGAAVVPGVPARSGFSAQGPVEARQGLVEAFQLLQDLRPRLFHASARSGLDRQGPVGEAGQGLLRTLETVEDDAPVIERPRMVRAERQHTCLS